MNRFSLTHHDLTAAEVPCHLYEHVIHRGAGEMIRKFLSTLLVLLASVVLASAEEGTVIRVYAHSFIVRSTTTPPSVRHPHGTNRIEHFLVNSATKFFVNGNKGSFADLQNGVHVEVKSRSGVEADRVDIVR
jgi:hypothetical protein